MMSITSAKTVAGTIGWLLKIKQSSTFPFSMWPVPIVEQPCLEKFIKQRRLSPTLLIFRMDENLILVDVYKRQEYGQRQRNCNLEDMDMDSWRRVADTLGIHTCLLYTSQGYHQRDALGLAGHRRGTRWRQGLGTLSKRADLPPEDSTDERRMGKRSGGVAERKVCRLCLCIGQTVEKGRFTHVRQADDAAL